MSRSANLVSAAVKRSFDFIVALAALIVFSPILLLLALIIKLTSPGPSKYFANQALQSARRWKFKPPQTDGQPTASTWLLKYQFGRAGTEIIPSETR